MTLRKRKAPAIPALPPSHLAALRDAGFEVVSYLATAVEVQPDPDGRARSEWLPRLAIAPARDGTGYRVLEWLPAGHPANAYGFDGWQASEGHSTGGFYRDVQGALGWFAWIVEARKGDYFGKGKGGQGLG